MMIYRYILAVLLVSAAMVTSGMADSTTDDNQGENNVQYPEPQIKLDRQNIKISAMVMWDLDRFDGTHGSIEDDGWITQSELRRARLGIKSQFNDQWKAKLQLTFNEADGSVEIDDAYIRFEKWRWATVLVGQAKEPFGLEALTSSKNLGMIERTMASGAFAPGRNPGLVLAGGLPRLTWSLGAFRALQREEQGDTYAATGRITAAPWKSKRGVFHLGAAGSMRDYDGEEYEIEETAEVHTAVEIIDTKNIAAQGVTLAGLEAALGLGPVLLQAEYMSAHVEAVEDNEDATYDGYYIQAGWLLTGEQRPYKKGVFGKVKPQADTGALELVARYSVLDARDNGSGTKAENATLGVNWYLNQHLCLRANYIHTELSGDMDTDESTGHAISARVQYVF